VVTCAPTCMQGCRAPAPGGRATIRPRNEPHSCVWGDSVPASHEWQHVSIQRRGGATRRADGESLRAPLAEAGLSGLASRVSSRPLPVSSAWPGFFPLGSGSTVTATPPCPVPSMEPVWHHFTRHHGGRHPAVPLRALDGNAQLDHDGARMGIRIRPAPQLNRDRPGALYWGS
jgi:hypothetical protein